jgi:ABC-type branched-subunit amino acid transport system substrate-binding protein
MWSCSSSTDCGDGYVCAMEASGQGLCVKGDSGGLFGVSDDKLVLGISAPLTSGPTELGLGMKAGIEAYFDVVNRAGGVNGRRLALMALDDGYDPDRALTNVKQLISAKSVFGFIGNVGTPTAAATVPYAVDHQTLFFGAFTGADLLRQDPPARYVFNYRASYAQETAGIVNYFTGTRDMPIDPSNIAVFPQGEAAQGGGLQLDAFGQSGFDGVAKALRAQFGLSEENIVRGLYERNTTDVNAAVQVFLKWLGDGQRPKTDGQISAAIVMVATSDPAAALVKAMLSQLSNIRQGGVPDAAFGLTQSEIAELASVRELLFSSVSFVGAEAFASALSGFGTYTNLSGLPDRFCTNVIVSQVVPPYDSDATGVIQYRQDLLSYDRNLKPGFVSLEGYVVARLFVEGLKRQGQSLTTETFIDTLETLSDVELGIGTKLSFSAEQHQASTRIWGTVMDGSCTYGPLDL